MAPAETICINMTTGNTRAMPANASVPRCETHQVSIRPVDAWASITRILGQARRSSVRTMAPRSSSRVRESTSAPRRPSDGSDANDLASGCGNHDALRFLPRTGLDGRRPVTGFF